MAATGQRVLPDDRSRGDVCAETFRAGKFTKVRNGGSGGHYPWAMFGIYESEIGQQGIRRRISSSAGAISNSM